MNTLALSPRSPPGTAHSLGDSLNPRSQPDAPRLGAPAPESRLVHPLVGHLPSLPTTALGLGWTITTGHGPRTQIRCSVKGSQEASHPSQPQETLISLSFQIVGAQVPFLRPPHIWILQLTQGAQPRAPDGGHRGRGDGGALSPRLPRLRVMLTEVGYCTPKAMDGLCHQVLSSWLWKSVR